MSFICQSDYDATIHRDILESLLRPDGDGAAEVEICENRAIAMVRGFLNARYDCDAVFGARGNERNVLVVKCCVDIAVYELFCQHNPYKMSAIRKERYEDALQFLKDVHDFNANIEGLPELSNEDVAANSRWVIDSNRLRDTAF